MYLTPEQRSIGQENFYAAIGSPLLQRLDLLKEINTQELKSGNGLGAKFFGYGTVEKPVRIAIIGTGDQGNVLIGAINRDYVQVVAIADIRPYNHHRAFHGDVTDATNKPGLIAKYGWKDEDEAREKVKVFGDYKELLDFYKGKEGDEGIEAVIIALPLFLHAPVAVAAMKQGCHVLIETLMARTVAECKEIARAAEENKKHCATGHQRHYNVLYDHAVRMIRDGQKSVLGAMHYIRAQWHREDRPGNDSWKQALPQKIKPDDPNSLEQVLAEFESELKRPGLSTADKQQIEKKIAKTKSQISDEILATGGECNGFTYKSAEEYGYVAKDARSAAEELIRWRLYNRTSAGLMSEYPLDAASMFLAATFEGKKRLPISVSATVSRTIFPGGSAGTPVDRDVEDHIHCVFDYPAADFEPDDDLGKLRKVTVAFSSINGNGFGENGETLFGTKGTLLIDSETEAMLYQRADTLKKTRITERTVAGAKELLITMDDAGDPLSAAIGLQATLNRTAKGYCEQIEHWAFCIRDNPEADMSKERPRCHPEVALADAVISLTTNIAALKGETVPFKEDWFKIESDATPEVEHIAKTDEEKKYFTPNLERYV